MFHVKKFLSCKSPVEWPICCFFWMFETFVPISTQTESYVSYSSRDFDTSKDVQRRLPVSCLELRCSSSQLGTQSKAPGLRGRRECKLFQIWYPFGQGLYLATWKTVFVGLLGRGHARKNMWLEDTLTSTHAAEKQKSWRGFPIYLFSPGISREGW